MPHLPRPRLVPASIPARVSIWIAGLFGVVQGAVITVAADERFASASYATVRSVPGGMNTWGIVAFVCGVLVLTGSLRRLLWVKNTGIVGLSVWCSALAIGASKAVADSPTAGPTGPGVYLAYSAAIAVLLIIDERETRS